MKAIICEYHPWDSVTRIGNHHYARLFLKSGWDVLWVSHPVSPLHGLRPENKNRYRRAMNGPMHHPDGPVEIVPNTLLPFYNAPVLGSRWVLQNSHRFYRPPIERLIRETGFDKPDVLWITDTVMHFMPDIVGAKAVAVRIADDNTEFDNMPHALKWAEDKLCDHADAIFATSNPLQQRLASQFGTKVKLLRNGVDIAHFRGEFPRPQEYRDIAGPIAIYVGAIEEWFATDWVESLAKSRPDITVVLIGREGADLSKLRTIGNVRILGTRPYGDIPAYLAHADVGIIPFRRTRLVESVSPLKLFEFFASGLPVVSTRWNELESLASPAYLANDAEEFVAMSGDCIDKKLKLQMRNEYIRYAMENSWDARFRSAIDGIQKINTEGDRHRS
jgi:glycosyltransferase involved in cell wall biosynthesis